MEEWTAALVAMGKRFGENRENGEGKEERGGVLLCGERE